MKLLLDTHAFIWASRETHRLSAAVLDIVGDTRHEVWISAASVWEIAIKRSHRRLAYPLEQLDGILDHLSLRMLPILPAHAIEAGKLPFHHRDPFDRMLIAQARLEGLTLVTDDQMMALYDVPRMEASR